jgi:hypothetical protein
LMTLAAIIAQQTLFATHGVDIDERLAQSIALRRRASAIHRRA